LVDNGRYQRDCEFISEKRGNNDYNRLRIGLRVSRMEKRYRAGIVEKTAHDTNFGKSTLYEYQAVWLLLWQWRGYSARRTFDELPWLTHTHLRKATVLPFEDALEAIEAIISGDIDFDRTIAEKGGEIDYPMDPDTFQVYINWRLGKPLPKRPLFNKTGYGYELLELVQRLSGGWLHKRVQMTVREMEE